MNQAMLDLLAPYSPEVRELALKTRTLVLKQVPEVQEQVDKTAKMLCYGFGPKYADSICVIMLAKEWVTLGFYRGTELPDPDALLEGKGKVHRHVKIKTEDDVKASALRKLLQEALKAYRQRKKEES